MKTVSGNAGLHGDENDHWDICINNSKQNNWCEFGSCWSQHTLAVIKKY